MIHPSYSPLFTLGLLADHSSTAELRSFLSLDLAHSAPSSHKRKLSKSTSWSCTTSRDSVAGTRRRTSKESLRTIPSPKPAPSATLPDLPSPHLSPASPKPLKRPVSALPLSVRKVPSFRSESISSYDRRKSHMDALACLEGRSRAPNRIPRRTPRRSNFMSFSDDEDEGKDGASSSRVRKSLVGHEDVSAFADVEDEADAIVPTLSRKRIATTRSARPTRRRRSTIESWFPLKSFIDLKDDDASWNWRSFIEIGGVA